MSCIGKALCTWSVQNQGLESSVMHFTHTCTYACSVSVTQEELVLLQSVM